MGLCVWFALRISVKFVLETCAKVVSLFNFDVHHFSVTRSFKLQVQFWGHVERSG
jgi:hypothetical protein